MNKHAFPGLVSLAGLLVLSPAAGPSPRDAQLFEPTALPAFVETGGLGPAPRLELSAPNFQQSFVVAQAGLMVDTRSRHQVAELFRTLYQPALAVPMEWSGDLGSCAAGTTSIAYAQATIDVVNYFRAMVGLPADIFENLANSAKAQEAALMMNAEGALDHSPPTDWACYSADGATAAGKSNLALGAAGSAAVSLYMRDPGSYNDFVGHRRWLLYPPQREMGTGSTGASVGYYGGANALWVLSGFGSRPTTPEWIAWPPAGYVPYSVTFPRWSFSINAASSQVDFRNATVSMTQQGVSLQLNVLPQKNDSGYADDTLVWEPVGAAGGGGLEDQTFHVQVGDVVVGGNTLDFAYDVTVFDPDRYVCHVLDDSLNLPLTRVVSLQSFEACGEIRAEQGFSIAATGTALFRAPSVVFGEGFSSEAHAVLSVFNETP